MEMCDVYDTKEQHTGRSVARGTQLPAGEYYMVVQVWIRNNAGHYLIQQRSAQQTYPGLWATTAGYALAGENSLEAAIREVAEELGITLLPTQLHQFHKLKMNNRIEVIWLAQVSQESISDLVLNGEVSDWKWAGKAEIKNMMGHGEFFSYSYFDILPE